MYRMNRQMRIEDFVFPYGQLDKNNEWVKLADLVPWDEAEEAYGEEAGFSRTFIYEVTQEFDFEWNKRGWWVCTKNEITDYNLLSVEYTPYLENNL